MSTRHFTPNENFRDDDGTLRWGMVIRKTLHQQAQTIGATPAKIPLSALSDRINILIVNNSTGGQILYVGDATVSTSNGTPLYPRQGLPLTIEDSVEVWGVASAEGADIRILEGS